MRSPSIAPLLAILGALPASAQHISVALEHHDECAVEYLDDVERASSNPDFEPVRLGAFLTDAGGEGSFVLKRFGVPNSKLFAFVSVFYEDDLLFGDMLEDAITFKLSVTESQSENPHENDWIALSTTQIPHVHFRVWQGALVFKNKDKTAGIMMRCEVGQLKNRAPSREKQ